jgi:hypothetical protein
VLKAEKRRISPDLAQELAIAALHYLAQDEDRLNGFLTNTGLSADNLREAANEPQFMSVLLDYITSDDTLVLSLAAEANVAPETIAAAAQYFHRDEF